MSSNVKFITGKGGLPAISIETAAASAEVYLHGAHLTRFQKKGGQPILWMSEKSLFDAGSAIRGGIPLVFPWFGARDGRQLKHGFARVKTWRLREISQKEGGNVSLYFELPAGTGDADFADLAAQYTITVGESLGLEFQVTNNSASRKVSFEECLHTYFTVGEIGAVSIHGLHGARYLDTVGGLNERVEFAESIGISSEVDRIYHDTPATVEIHDSKLRRIIKIEKQGSLSTVVWNPWIAKSKAMADFGDEEFLGMLCVESGNVRSNAVNLAPGQSSKLSVKISSVAV
jgi:D-hexose-6-phosphate mutarotase